MPTRLLLFKKTTTEAARLDDFLAEVLPPALEKVQEAGTLSKSKVRRLIVAGAVSVNGRCERRAAAMLKGVTGIQVRYDSEKFSYEKQPDDIVFELTAERILFEDETIIIVDKPAAFPTEATMVAGRDHLHAAVARYIGRRDGLDSDGNAPYIGLHHRLDRDTTGVILFTKQRAANAAVHRMFLEHLARKEYLALTIAPARHLRLSAGSCFRVENSLGRISAKSAQGKWGAVSAGGDPALTDFTVVEERAGFMQILAKPLTGRTHQIRVHLAGYGLPLLGDTLYGGPTRLGSLAVPRVMLHAETLIFPHPLSGVETRVSAPLPPDFREIISLKA